MWGGPHLPGNRVSPGRHCAVLLPALLQPLSSSSPVHPGPPGLRLQGLAMLFRPTETTWMAHMPRLPLPVFKAPLSLFRRTEKNLPQIYLLSSSLAVAALHRLIVHCMFLCWSSVSVTSNANEKPFHPPTSVFIVQFLYIFPYLLISFSSTLV